jgi:hypothetical protein
VHEAVIVDEPPAWIGLGGFADSVQAGTALFTCIVYEPWPANSDPL